MKKLIVSLVTSALMTGAVWSQETKGEPKSEFQAGKPSDLDVQRKQQQVEKPVLKAPTGSRKPQDRQIAYGGFFVDAAKSGRPLKALNLRTPTTGTNATANVYSDPETGKPRGFVLFAIKF